MKSLNIIIALFMAIGMICCESIDAETTLCQVEDDLLAGKIELAASGCDMLTDSTNNHNLSSTQMCRVAIVYAKLSDMADNQDYMASATQCFERAVTLDNKTDSLDRYIESLDVETQSVVSLIREVSRTINSPYDYSKEDDEDCVSDTDEYVEYTEVAQITPQK